MKNKNEDNQIVEGKHNDYWYKILVILIIILIAILIVPFTINKLLGIVSGNGSNDGWLGFWGGYLGSIIAIIFAYINTKMQLRREQIKELKKRKHRLISIRDGLNNTLRSEEVNRKKSDDFDKTAKNGGNENHIAYMASIGLWETRIIILNDLKEELKDNSYYDEYYKVAQLIKNINEIPRRMNADVNAARLLAKPMLKLGVLIENIENELKYRYV